MAVDIRRVSNCCRVERLLLQSKIFGRTFEEFLKRFIKAVKRVWKNVILELDMMSDIPIYLQIRNQVILGIAEGKLKGGDALPTIRQMASDAGINTMTVNKAYQELKSEGYIEIDRRQGAKIAQKIPIFSDDTGMEDRIRLLYAESRLRGMSKEHWNKLLNQMDREMEGLK